MDNNKTYLLPPDDQTALQEFIDALSDHVPHIEQDVANLKLNPDDKVLISNLFRSLHTVKGDAALCKVEIGVLIAHPVESVIARIRTGEIGFSEVLAEAVLLAIDQLELAVHAMAESRSLHTLRLEALLDALDALEKTPAADLDEGAAKLIETVTGFRPASLANLPARKPGRKPADTRTAVDLGFFRTLALQYEARSPLFRGRSQRQLELALDTNEAAGAPVDPLQLEAAIYMHDIGMLFVPESAWLHAQHLTQEDRQQLHFHPGYGAGLLQRMPGWQPAAAIIMQHHERHDGKGYPLGLKNDQINDGAKILAIVDTYESVTLKHSQHGERRSLVRAMAEINACDDQFDPRWIVHFNTVIRGMIEG